MDVTKARNINIMLGRVKYSFSELSTAILRLDENVIDEAIVDQFIAAIPFSLVRISLTCLFGMMWVLVSDLFSLLFFR